MIRQVALNASGYGKSSSAFSGGQTFLDNRPRKMYTPRQFRTTHNTIELRWTNLPRKSRVKGKRVYSLYWNKGGDRAPLTKLVDRIDDNKYKVTGLEPDKTYKFKLLAVNECGVGPFSKIETVKTWSCPTTPSVAKTSRDGEELVVNWEDAYAKPNRRSKAKVTAY